MKTILVLTDFSSAAEHATQYAVMLAKTANASVTLLHAYQLPIPITEVPVLAVLPEDLKQAADAGLQRAKEAALVLAPGIVFQTESRMGNTVEEAIDFCKEHDVLAVVTGVKAESGFERFLFGTTSLSLVKKCLHPVISVAEGAAIRPPKNIALAVDFISVEKIPAEKILSIVGILQARLHVIHVETEGNPTAEPSPLLSALGTDSSSYHSVKEEDVTEGIKRLAAQNDVDLVVALPHRHTLLERLFFKGHTAGMVQGLPLPVMTLQNSSE